MGTSSSDPYAEERPGHGGAADVRVRAAAVAVVCMLAVTAAGPAMAAAVGSDASVLKSRHPSQQHPREGRLKHTAGKDATLRKHAWTTPIPSQQESTITGTHAACLLLEQLWASSLRESSRTSSHPSASLALQPCAYYAYIRGGVKQALTTTGLFKRALCCGCGCRATSVPGAPPTKKSWTRALSMISVSLRGSFDQGGRGATTGMYTHSGAELRAAFGQAYASAHRQPRRMDLRTAVHHRLRGDGPRGACVPGISSHAHRASITCLSKPVSQK